ncbi:MAG: SIMPL domain-containing protein [Patescibacteria group bacterium]
MNQRIQNALYIVGTFTLAAVAVSALAYVKTYSRAAEPTSFRSFSVSGDGKAVVVPDVAEFSFTVITEGKDDVAVLQTKNTEKTNAAIDYLKAQGVDKKDIRTQGYNVSPSYQYYPCTGVAPCPPPSIVGYTVSQSVGVKVHDFAKAGTLLSGVVANGANSVSGLQFTVDDPTASENEARAEAFAKAQAKAKDIAEAGNFRLGRLLSVSEGTSGQPPVYPLAYGGERDMMAETKAAVPTPTIEPGSQEVNISVTLQYEIR